MVPVVAVLLVWSFSRRGVVAVTARAAVGVSVRPSITVVVLIAMRVIGMMPISLPRWVAVTWVAVFTVPLPVSSICKKKRKKREKNTSKLTLTDRCLIFLPLNNHQTHVPSLLKCRLLALYGSLWCPWGPGWVECDADLEVGWVPVESRLEPDGSGLNDFTLPETSSFFFCSFCKCHRIISALLSHSITGQV